jgi:hypothetical protein
MSRRDATLDDRLRAAAARCAGRRAARRRGAAGARRALPPAIAAPRHVQDRPRALLAEHGIAYESRRELGTPPDIRTLFRAGRTAEARAAFRDHVETGAAGDVAALADELPGAPPTALLCLEADPAVCHRRVLTEALAKQMPDLIVIDL